MGRASRHVHAQPVQQRRQRRLPHRHRDSHDVPLGLLHAGLHLPSGEVQPQQLWAAPPVERQRQKNDLVTPCLGGGCRPKYTCGFPATPGMFSHACFTHYTQAALCSRSAPSRASWTGARRRSRPTASWASPTRAAPSAAATAATRDDLCAAGPVAGQLARGHELLIYFWVCRHHSKDRAAALCASASAKVCASRVLSRACRLFWDVDTIKVCNWFVSGTW